MSSSMNLKIRVKNGEILPQEALKRLAMKSINVEQALKSRTARWLSSPNAQRRFEQARKAKKASK